MSAMKHALQATLNGVTYTWEVEADAPPLVIEAARKGFQEWLGDAASTAMPSHEEQEADEYKNRDHDPASRKKYLDWMVPIRQRAVEARLAQIRDGSYSPGGGGGSRKSPDEKGLLAWLATKNWEPKRIMTGEVTKNGTPKTKAEPTMALVERFVQDFCEQNDKPFTAEAVEKVLAVIRKSEVYLVASGKKKSKDLDASLLD